MNKFLPNKSETSMLVIGILIGSLLSFYNPGWATIVLAVPIILLISLIIYFLEKKKSNFEVELRKANNAKELLKKD